MYGKLRFSKNWSPTSLYSDLRYSFFELVSYSFQRGSIKYMNLGRISCLWISSHLALITHDATTSVNSSIVCLLFSFHNFCDEVTLLNWLAAERQFFNCFVIQLLKNMWKYASSEVPPAFNDRSTRRSQNNPSRWSNGCIAIRYSVKIALSHFP